MKLKYAHGNEIFDLDLERDGQVFTVRVGDETLTLEGEALQDGRLHLWVNGNPMTAVVAKNGADRYIHSQGRPIKLQRVTQNRRKRAGGDAEGGLTSPMPGQVLKVLVAVGDAVEAGQTLMLIEAMKMEHAIKAPYAGVVGAVNHSEGDMVDPGSPLLAIEKSAE